jgi:hypothetical protein
LLIKVIRGCSPGKLCQYVLDPQKQTQSKQEAIKATQSITPVLICSTMPGKTVGQLTQNFRLIAKLNPRVIKTVAHYSVSLPPSDAGKVEWQEMALITTSMLYALGHSRCPYFAVQHHDANQTHWHVVASTIRYDGIWVDDSFERYRLRILEQQLEKRFKLTLSQHRSAEEVKNLSTGEYRWKANKGETLPKEKLWAALDSCIEKDISLTKFILRLRAEHPEISIRFNEQGNQKVGISFGIDGIGFAGRSLGRGYSMQGLESYYGIRHDVELEPLLNQVLKLSATECEELYLSLEGTSKNLTSLKNSNFER